jgi:hypothetical protein
MRIQVDLKKKQKANNEQKSGKNPMQIGLMTVK